MGKAKSGIMGNHDRPFRAIPFDHGPTGGYAAVYGHQLVGVETLVQGGGNGPTLTQLQP